MVSPLWSVFAALLVATVGCAGGAEGDDERPSRQMPADESEAAELPADGETTATTAPVSAASSTAPAAKKTEYAPYFYSWGWDNPAYPFTSLVDMSKKTGLNAATLAFVTAPNGACATSRAVPNHKRDVDAFRAAGGQLKVSFGGASGTYLENGCTTVSSLATAISSFVVETGLTDLDFDVEQAVAMNATVNARRSAALAAVQKAKGIKVSFTLPAIPATAKGVGGGMTAAAYAVVKSALDAGVVISHVNLMTMDYGTSFSAGRTMGELAISAINGCAAQLRTLMPALNDAEVYGTVGATPMIGQNDVESEVFTLDDAKTLVAFARAKNLGLVSLWALQRDVPCSGTVDPAMCTGAQKTRFEFNAIFRNAA